MTFAATCPVCEGYKKIAVKTFQVNYTANKTTTAKDIIQKQGGEYMLKLCPVCNGSGVLSSQAVSV